MGIPDLLVTLLFLKQKREALDAYLDIERPDVHFVQRQSHELDCCIRQKGSVASVCRSLFGILHNGNDACFRFSNEGETWGFGTSSSDTVSTDPQLGVGPRSPSDRTARLVRRTASRL